MFQYLGALAHKNDEARIIVAYEASLLEFGIYDDCVEAGIQRYTKVHLKVKSSTRYVVRNIPKVVYNQYRETKLV